MKRLLTITICLLTFFDCYGQDMLKWGPEFKGSKLDSIGQRLLNGDKAALVDIAPYLDSKKLLTDHLGYHILQIPESSIAERLIDENCIFLKSEYDAKRDTSAKLFLAFLNRYRDKIIFDGDANAFLITPLNKREVRFDIKQLPASTLAELRAQQASILNNPWVSLNHIDVLVKNKLAQCLYKIASDFFKDRNRFDHYSYNTGHYNLIELLTGTQIGIEDETGRLNYHADAEFYNNVRLNLLIYFTKYYRQYTYDDSQGTFINNKAIAKNTAKEEDDFALLKSKTDSVAMNAFIRLTTADTAKVKLLANEFEKADIRKNDALPIFAYRFLKQMVALTTYCKANGVDFLGTPQLLQSIAKLKSSHIDYGDRQKLENALINKLTLDDITAFEYWSLVNEESWGLTYSAGRILNIFYSKNWDKIIHDKKQLDLYLKKSWLFDALGIIGICNNYLVKFTANGQAVADILQKNNSTDVDIKRQTTKAITLAQKPYLPETIGKKIFDGNYDTTVINLPAQFKLITTTAKDSDDRVSRLNKLISCINYNQIGITISLIKKYNYKVRWRSKYEFLQADFGFLWGDFDKPAQLAEFLSHYNSTTQQGMYKWYLDKWGVNYTNANHTLNYDKIYDILKYNLVVSFVGGGGGMHNNDVYAAIKLLELHFKTTLGYPIKLCNSNQVYGCNADHRATEWMTYLTKKHLLKLPHNEPVSFNFQ